MTDPTSLRAETRRAIEQWACVRYDPDGIGAWGRVRLAIEAEIAARVPSVGCSYETMARAMCVALIGDDVEWRQHVTNGMRLKEALRAAGYVIASLPEPPGAEGKSEATTACLNDPPRTREAAALAIARKALVAIRRGVPSPTQTAEQALIDIAIVMGDGG